jgi:hypothetical protein
MGIDLRSVGGICRVFRGVVKEADILTEARKPLAA